MAARGCHPCAVANSRLRPPKFGQRNLSQTGNGKLRGRKRREGELITTNFRLPGAIAIVSCVVRDVHVQRPECWPDPLILKSVSIGADIAIAYCACLLLLSISRNSVSIGTEIAIANCYCQ